MKRYSLKDFVHMLEEAGFNPQTFLGNQEESLVEELTYDSKAAIPGTFFVCKGANFKPAYLEDALELGAVAYIAEQEFDLGREVPHILVEDIRLVMPYLADLFFDSPSKKLTLIGLGGTKGKTTTAFFVKSILDTHLKAQGGKTCGIISSIVTDLGNGEFPSINTTPEAIELQRFFAQAVEAGLSHLVMEVSSQALKYNRVDLVHFDVGLFLNISEDHISPVEHPDFEDYFSSKLSMFKQTDLAIINKDAYFIERILDSAKDAKRSLTYSLENDQADYYTTSIQPQLQGSHFSAMGPEGPLEVDLKMSGRFNVSNALAALAIARNLGVSDEAISQGLAKASVSGRMETMVSDNGQLVAIVDFAHNKGSFEEFFDSAKRAYSDFKIVAIFGAPGGKAENRRQELGQVAALNADQIIITEDDPDFESPADICDEIAQTVSQYATPYKIIVDREEAIKTAFKKSQVQEKTLLAILGKGHETTTKLNGKLIDVETDRQLAEKYMTLYNQGNL